MRIRLRVLIILCMQQSPKSQRKRANRTPRKLQSLHSLEAALDEALTEQGSILKAFPTKERDL